MAGLGLYSNLSHFRVSADHYHINLPLAPNNTPGDPTTTTMNRILYPIVLSFIFLSCAKDSSPPEPAPDPQQPDPGKAVSVYVAGDSFNLTTQYRPYAVYWKNGEQQHLPHPGYASANSIAVQEDDVYVTCENGYTLNAITFWKNNVSYNLADQAINHPFIRDIEVSGPDVYTLGVTPVNGGEKSVPVYWKNQGPPNLIQTMEFTSGDARAIAVTGSDIYIAGSVYNPTAQQSVAGYWKNGNPTFLDDGINISQRGLAKALVLNGADVHVTGEIEGWDETRAIYWKNKVPSYLAGPDSSSYANALAVSGNDVYIAGAVAGPDRQQHAAYWKNGKLTVLDYRYSMANAIAVNGSDVYVASNRSVDSAFLWKNGIPTALGRGRANAILLIKE